MTPVRRVWVRLLGHKEFGSFAEQVWGPWALGGHLLQSCSMVAHCSDFFHVWASSSFLVLTASRSRLMLSCKKPEKKVP